MIELSSYAFEPLRSDATSILYRGLSGGGVSPILMVSLVAEYPTPESVKRLEHEYSLREDLGSDWAARPIAITRHRDRTALLLEDSGGVPLDQLLGSPLDLVFSLRLAVGLASALEQLHQRGIIHKDIKPANVLVNPATGQCWLRGFGIASRLPRERQAVEPPEFVAGTLAYMAPEQTGRMNRSIDSRSDLYSFGVTLYEMLTGSLPFNAFEPMEWVHCHIAKKPIPPHERPGNVPAPLSAIVMKLLAKNAEDRYQTAAGVEADLRRCLADWQTHRHMHSFPLGQSDTPNRLLIPERLYGRTKEIDELLASFDRVVASGRPELVLVYGYSGIGKSSVVNEVHKVLVPPRGLFASGKFDQYKRDIPYATLAQAFQGLIRPLLGKSEGELRGWRDALREALGPHGRLIVDLVPELTLIIGEQPPVPELPPQDAQSRFQMVFRRFIGVFARPEHPLALFLDDLQWLDAATLDLLQDLLTRDDVRHLMLIGAYRDNEVSSSHPLVRKLEAIRKAGATVRDISLMPLSRADLGHLLADCLLSGPEKVAPLAELVHEKTAGNPFFAIQFVQTLVEEALLSFERPTAAWSWDVGRIHAKGYTDNVVDLMVGKLGRLPAETQQALQELACLGNSAETRNLAIVHGTTEGEVHSVLWDALRSEFIQAPAGTYRFVHDRVQEAAYSLIPGDQRARAHLRIGRLLVEHTPPAKRDETIFEIVNQFNRAESLLTAQTERETAAELNLAAGLRAKASTAYASALRYFVAGGALLDAEARARRHDLSFPLELNRAECEFLTGDFAAAEQHLAALASLAADAVEQSKVVCLRVDLYTTLNQSDRAIAVCREYFKAQGVEWSAHPTAEEGAREYQRIKARLAGRSIESLIELPLMTDPVSLAIMDVLTKVYPPALFIDAKLMSLAVCWAVNLSLTHGNSDGSCVAYVWLGMIAGPHFGDYESGFEFGRLGYVLVEKRGLTRFKARTYLWFAQFVVPWTRHVRECRDLMRRAFDAANESSDMTIAAYSCNNLNTNFLAAGDPLDETQREAEKGHEFSQKAGFGFVVDIIAGQLGLIRTLRGSTPSFGRFDDDAFDEAAFERHLASEPSLALPECWYWTRKLQARYFAGLYADALEAAAQAERLLWTSPSIFESAEVRFYAALAWAASYAEAPAEKRARCLEAIAAHQEQLDVWAAHGPANFENRAALVRAETARILDRPLEAQALYERAIASAQANGFVQNEALANELAGSFYAARGFDKIARTYLRDAQYCYLRWGADAKVRQLAERHPYLRQAERPSDPTKTIDAPVEHLDLATVMKVSQAVSSEIVVEKLLDTLMRTAIEHAGAERGLLIATGGDRHRIEADARTTAAGITVQLGGDGAIGAAVPESIIQYVMRTQDNVIVDDAAADNDFSTDAYLHERRARSILCLPLVHQGKTVAVLYLENNLAPRVFTPARISILKLLASQAAISLENTRLYRDLQVREAKIRRLVDANVMGIFFWSLDGDITEANDAFLRIIGYTREDLVAGRINWQDLTPAEWRDRDLRAVSEVTTTSSLQPYEKQYIRRDGGRVDVLLGAALFETAGREGVAFVLDVSEQKRAQEALRRSEADLAQAQADLAHVTRVTTLGELTASLAHEINQPLAAVVNNANAGLRWISRETPDLEEAREALRQVIRDGHRAGEVIARVRQLFKKTRALREPVDINGAIDDVILFTRAEALRNRVVVHAELEDDLPRILGDRVQLQQVILNLMVNSVEAMSQSSDGPRELWVSSSRDERTPADAGQPRILVRVRDSGPGLTAGQIERAFDPFYTTKSGGLGMGLAISRSIIEAHGGRLWAAASPAGGASFQFTLPFGARA